MPIVGINSLLALPDLGTEGLMLCFESLNPMPESSSTMKVIEVSQSCLLPAYSMSQQNPCAALSYSKHATAHVPDYVFLHSVNRRKEVAVVKEGRKLDMSC